MSRSVPSIGLRGDYKPVAKRTVRNRLIAPVPNGTSGKSGNRNSKISSGICFPLLPKGKLCGSRITLHFTCRQFRGYKANFKITRRNTDSKNEFGNTHKEGNSSTRFRG